MASGVASRPERVRIHLCGTFDGSQAMQLAHWLRGQHAAEVVVDFADVDSIERFGVDVLLGELGALRASGPVVCFAGVPPCMMDRLVEAGAAVSSSLRHPRWAPWTP